MIRHSGSRSSQYHQDFRGSELMNARVRRRKLAPSQGPLPTRPDAPSKFAGPAVWTEILLYALIVFALVFGGGAISANPRILLICVTAAALLPLALWAGAGRAFRRLPLLAQVAVVLVPLLPLLQLVPLPPSIWGGFPGRELPTTIFDLVGSGSEWHPLSLTPRDTALAALCLLAPIAAFFAALTLDEHARERCVMLVLGVAAVSIFVGLIQLGSRGATLDFYGSTHRGFLLGFFANRNHEGDFIALAAVFAIAFAHRKLRYRQGLLAWSVILSLTFLVAAVGTISRAGLGLTVLGIAMMQFAHFGQALNRRRLILIAAAIAIAALAIYLLSFTSVVERSLSRFNGVSDDDRLRLWQLSAPLVTQYFPWGSGLGSFVPAYAAIEPLDSVSRVYLNHAHNEYLELLIEGGLPAMAVLGVAVVALLTRGLRVLFGKGRLAAFGLPSAIGLLLVALHSIVDYPLRTQSIAVLFGVMAAFFFAESPTRMRVRVDSARPAEE
ncbi:O-antigen ligase family protein [Sphingopyxis indica]|nr:O-antigen ligase family protein [Sphingopyxis indica]